MSYHQYYDEGDYEKKRRHGFVTVWLIIGIVLNSLATLMCFFGKDTVQRYSENELPDYLVYILAGLSLLKVGCHVLLLMWKKIGFWLYIPIALGVFAIDLYSGMEDPQMLVRSVFGLLGVGVLFLVLQVRKFGTSCWEYLD